MTKTIRIITLLLLTMVSTGHAWAQDEEYQFGHITYNGTAANDGGTLTFYTRLKDAEQGQNAVAPNGTGPTDLTDIMVRIDGEWESVGTGFFIKATPAVGHRLPAPAADGTVSFIRAEVVTQAQQAPSHRAVPTLQVGQTLPVKFHSYYSGFGGDPATDYYGLYYVVMPADVNLSVSITATFPEAEKNTEAINYVDADGTTQTKAAGEVYVLDGTEARLGYGSYNNRTEHETWYVLPENATYNYTNGLELYGKVHLILGDGATMTIGTDSKPVEGNALYVWGDLDIYDQGDETEGAISAVTTASAGIFITGDATINGGNVSAESTNKEDSHSCGIKVEGHLTINRGNVSGKSKDRGIEGVIFTINGGTVSGTGTNESGISTGVNCLLTITGGHVTGVGGVNGFWVGNNLTITGGQIEATGGTDEGNAGLFSNHGDIILGWTNPTDYIQANSFRCGNYETSGMVVKTVEGQRFVAYNMADESDVSASAIASGTVDDVTLLAGKTLRPLDGNYVIANPDVFTFSGSTSLTSPFDITTGEGENETTTHYYICKKEDPVTLSYAGSDFVMLSGLPEGTTLAAVEGQPMQRTFTMPATDVVLTATAMALTATPVAYNGTARTPEIKQGDDVFDAANYAIAYQLGEEAVSEAKNVNTYTCVLTGLDQYVGTATVPFDITLRSTNIAVEIVNSETTVDGNPVLIAGEDAHVKVTLVPIKGENETTELPKINGIATIIMTIGEVDKPYNVAIVNGEGHFYVTNLAQDAYAITASFAGDANHAASTTENATTLEVCMILTETSVSLDKTEINVGESVTVTAKINEVGLQRPVIDSETGKNKECRYPEADVKPLSIDAIVTVKCKTTFDYEQYLIDPNYDTNNYTLAIVNGQGIKTFSHLPAGPRTVNVVYAGDDRYVQSISTVENLQVNKTETTIGVEVTSPVIAK